MSWLLIGIGGAVILAILIYFLAPRSKDSKRRLSSSVDETPLAATRVAEEIHHGAQIGALQGKGLVDGVGPFTGTLPRRKTKKNQHQ